MCKEKVVYPYIPNSAPEAQKEMMDFVGVKDLWDLYEEIPESLKFREKLDIPDAILDEYSIKKHAEKILAKNKNCSEYTNFLGAGCAQHFIPAVVDEITTRGEFLTCYGAESWADHGKYQTFFEYNSMLAELLDTEVMSVPQYDGGQAAATSLAMANRINGRKQVLLPELMNPQNKSAVENYMASVQKELEVEIVYVGYNKETGSIDMEDFKNKINSNVSAVLIENPGFLGVLEPNAEEIGKYAKDAGAEFIVYVNPISLGV
ncbi:MAG: aminomethyl-transferring glycine dehydrogenase, partial [Lachnospiraceae bacterium]|nr:aminomethyl-transferring glycine dehydrogenase [Lachnospiraceae bacterium]